MPDDDERRLTPELGFPEFRKGKGWVETKLENVADFVSERIALKDLRRSDYVSTESMLPDFAGIAAPSSSPTSGTATRFKVNDVLISNIRPI